MARKSFPSSKVLGKNSMKKSKESYNKEDLIHIENAKKIVNDWEEYEKVRGKLIRKRTQLLRRYWENIKGVRKERIIHC